MTAKNRADIQTEIDTLAADNASGGISAEDIRDLLETQKDSNLNLTETANQSLASPLNGAKITTETTRTGVMDYNDAATSTTPISVTASTWTNLTNDGAGSFTNKAYKVGGISELWNTTTNQFDFTDLSLGDSLAIRFDVSVTTTVANQSVQLRLQLGVGGTPYTLQFADRYYKTSGTYQIVDTEMFYMGDTNTLNNPANWQVYSDSSCTVTVNGKAILHNVRGE